MSDAIVPKGQPISGDPEKKGWLFKWTNYLKGYQRRWFVLSNGLLSYYRNQAEMAHTCRGTISLLGALIHTADSCTFVISNGGTQTFHIRAHDEVERQSWVTALELAKAKAIRAQESDDDEDQIGSNAVTIAGGGEAEGEDVGGIARELAARFHDLRTCSELVARHGAVLQRSLVDLEIPPSDITIQVGERATLFRISCNAMMNACSEFMTAAGASTARMSRALQHEREQKMRLQEVVEQLARQHDNLEKTVTARSTPHTVTTTPSPNSVSGAGTQEHNDTTLKSTDLTFESISETVWTATEKLRDTAKIASEQLIKTSTEASEQLQETAQNASAKLHALARNLDGKLTTREINDKLAQVVKETNEKLNETTKRANLQIKETARDAFVTIAKSTKQAQDNLAKTVKSREKSQLEKAQLGKDQSGKKKIEKNRLSSEPGTSSSRNLGFIAASKIRLLGQKDGGNGTGQGNETEDEDHEFFDAMEEGVSANSDDKTAFVMKVPVNRKSKVKSGESSDESEGETVTETHQVVFVKDKEGENMGRVTDEAAGAVNKPKEDIKVWPHVSQVVSMVDNHTRRSRVPDKPNYPLSLWSIMKNCIGKELSKIPIPVNFSEPLSMLQRLTEDYEYSYILDEAAKFSDPAQQLAYVAAFTISAYATTSNRTNKPFNPLLGETYECDRMTDLGWRSISEQVSHHPPMVAQFCEGQAGWQCWQEFTMTTKFRGKYLQVIPLGGAYAAFPASGNKYTWRKVYHHPPTCAVHTEGMAGWKHCQQWSISSRFRGQYVTVSPDSKCFIVYGHSGNKYFYEKVTTTVHNIIVGKLWVDNHGDMDIKGEAGPATGYVAHLKYLPYAYFSKDTQRKVTGVVNDPKGVPRYVLQGFWDSRVEVAPVTSASADGTQCTTGKFVVAWERVPAPPDSDKWYNFTLLAAQLNEQESGVAPTDSRLRPDQRLMEEGLWNEANDEKLRLEEKQRTKRRELEAATEAAAAAGQPAPPAPRPLWFSRESVDTPGNPHLCHMYNHRYWESKKRQDWADCPDIF